MADLSETERAQIRWYLGWPSRFFQTQSDLEQAMNAANAVPETLTLVRSTLTALVATDTAILGARMRFQAAAVGSITLQGNTELALLRSQGRQDVGRLAAGLGVAPLHDVYSGCAPASHSNLLMGV